MKMKTNSRRLTRAVLIGLVGVLVLSVSAFAAWGSSSGYGKYKDAVTKIFTETDNVTIDADTSILYDGDVAFHGEYQMKIDGNDYAQYERSTLSDNTDEYGNEFQLTAIGNTETYFYTQEDWYGQYERDMNYADNPLSLGDYGDKVVKFGKLCADTVLGDLKNNVVLVDDKNGIRSYSLEVTADQIPALINSGIDLVMTASGSSGGYVTFENTDDAFAFYYEKSKGKALPEGYFDNLYGEDSSEEMWEEYNEIHSEMCAYYEEIRVKSGDGSVLYVKADGSYDVYEDYSSYAMSTEYGTSNMEAYLGKNAVLHKVKFDFSLDKEDRLVANDLSIIFSSTGNDGKGHTVELRLNVDFSDYGTTEVLPLDTGDRQLNTK